MPSSPYPISLGDAERAELKSLSRRATAPFRLVVRARIVLLAADGVANCAIAERLGICEDTARKWRRRYCAQGIEGLADAPRPGRPRVFPATVVAGVKALACELPAASGMPLARWTCPELARHAAASGIAPAPSASAVRRWLADDVLKPWQHRSWIFPRDPLLPSRPPASWTAQSPARATRLLPQRNRLLPSRLADSVLGPPLPPPHPGEGPLRSRRPVLRPPWRRYRHPKRRRLHETPLANAG